MTERAPGPEARPALAALQEALRALYRLPEVPSVSAFVCDEEITRRLAGDDVVARGEALVLVEHEGEWSMGLYLRDDALLAGAPDPYAAAADFGAACLAAEGVSHFVYLQYRSALEAPATELELELQAEVDKWALGVLGEGLLAGYGVGLFRERSRAMRERLFAQASLRDPPGTERGERYRTALRLAARYAAELERRYVDEGEIEGLLGELRRFYRLGAGDKLARIR